MPGRPERHPLGRNRRIGTLVVVGGDQPINVDEHRRVRRAPARSLTAIWCVSPPTRPRLRLPTGAETPFSETSRGSTSLVRRLPRACRPSRRSLLRRRPRRPATPGGRPRRCSPRRGWFASAEWRPIRTEMAKPLPSRCSASARWIERAQSIPCRAESNATKNPSPVELTISPHSSRPDRGACRRASAGAAPRRSLPSSLGEVRRPDDVGEHERLARLDRDRRVAPRPPAARVRRPPRPAWRPAARTRREPPGARRSAESSSPVARSAFARSARARATSYGAATSRQRRIATRASRADPAASPSARSTRASAWCLPASRAGDVIRVDDPGKLVCRRPGQSRIAGGDGDLDLGGQQPDLRPLVPRRFCQGRLDRGRGGTLILPWARRISARAGCGVLPIEWASRRAVSAASKSPFRRRISPIAYSPSANGGMAP